MKYIPILSKVPGFSHLASEYYEVRYPLTMTLTKTLMEDINEKVREVDPDSDNISLDSLHIRVLERCVTKYQPPDRCKNKLFSYF